MTQELKYSYKELKAILLDITRRINAITKRWCRIEIYMSTLDAAHSREEFELSIEAHNGNYDRYHFKSFEDLHAKIDGIIENLKAKEQ